MRDWLPRIPRRLCARRSRTRFPLASPTDAGAWYGSPAARGGGAIPRPGQTPTRPGRCRTFTVRPLSNGKPRMILGDLAEFLSISSAASLDVIRRSLSPTEVFRLYSVIPGLFLAGVPVTGQRIQRPFGDVPRARPRRCGLRRQTPPPPEGQACPRPTQVPRSRRVQSGPWLDDDPYSSEMDQSSTPGNPQGAG